jgi:hypothetical protein
LFFFSRNPSFDTCQTLIGKERAAHINVNRAKTLAVAQEAIATAINPEAHWRPTLIAGWRSGKFLRLEIVSIYDMALHYSNRHAIVFLV